ncbi:MAG: Ca-activated chloride channel family protein, partial [Saprospiraceae bacterium]
MFLFFNNISFLNPEFFGLLLLLPAIGAWYFFKRKQHYPTLKMPNLDSISALNSWRGKLRGILPILRALAFIMLVIAIARPQETLKEEEIKAEGIDIFLVLDVSYSMLAKDLTPDRMEASKRGAIDFVEGRKHDRIGLALFGGEAFTQCPLTTDHRVVKEFLAGTKAGILGEGTAIGMGLSSAVNHIKDSESESKIIILLTDGVSNIGYIQPMTAAEIAVEFGVKVYTIGVGTKGEALYPVNPTSKRL